MQFELNVAGNPTSALASALAIRLLNLDESGKSPHPLQSHTHLWMNFGNSFAEHVKLLSQAEYAKPANPELLCDAFRRLCYDVTEIFDLYATLLVSRLGKRRGKQRDLVRDYERAAKKLRRPWALICNRCKHNGSQIRFVWVTSEVDPGFGTGRLVGAEPFPS